MVTQQAYMVKKTNGVKKKPASRMGTSGWMLVFFACGCMFLLGVLVGRNNAPVNFDMESLEEKLDGLQTSVLADAGNAAPQNLEELPFDFYDQLRQDTPAETEVGDVISGTFKRTKYGRKPRSAMTAKVMQPGEVPAEVLANAPDPKLASADTTSEDDQSANAGSAPMLASVQPATAVTEKKIEKIKTEQEIARNEPQPALAPEPVKTTVAETPPLISEEEEPETVPDARESLQPVVTADQTPEPPEKPAAKGESVRGYAIQVASLKEPDKANTVRDKFRSKGYPAYTQQAVVEGKGQWCRVRIGPYPDKAHAQSDLVRLQKAGVDAILFFAE